MAIHVTYTMGVLPKFAISILPGTKYLAGCHMHWQAGSLCEPSGIQTILTGSAIK